MALQIVSTFHAVWTEAGLPIWVRPFEVLVTSSHSALIEVVKDAPSIHALKAQLAPGTNLADYFQATYGDGTPAYRNAQRNFVESMAGYSIISYLFQLKDRHNGNLLLDAEGHVIHIDFSFMLANSPGGLNFESAPFKLTKELLEVMESDADGAPSDAFNYFKVLCIQGFLEARKQAERILLLVEMMQGSNIPCLRGGARVVQQLRKRFHLAATEEQCVELVLGLVGDSLDAWCMRSYDQYQRVANGIL
jgi:phosphatidylinositol 4-kinase